MTLIFLKASDLICGDEGVFADSPQRGLEACFLLATSKPLLRCFAPRRIGKGLQARANCLEHLMQQYTPVTAQFAKKLILVGPRLGFTDVQEWVSIKAPFLQDLAILGLPRAVTNEMQFSTLFPISQMNSSLTGGRFLKHLTLSTMNIQIATQLVSSFLPKVLVSLRWMVGDENSSDTMKILACGLNVKNDDPTTSLCGGFGPTLQELYCSGLADWSLLIVFEHFKALRILFDEKSANNYIHTKTKTMRRLFYRSENYYLRKLSLISSTTAPAIAGACEIEWQDCFELPPEPQKSQDQLRKEHEHEHVQPFDNMVEFSLSFAQLSCTGIRALFSQQYSLFPSLRVLTIGQIREQSELNALCNALESSSSQIETLNIACPLVKSGAVCFSDFGGLAELAKTLKHLSFQKNYHFPSSLTREWREATGYVRTQRFFPVLPVLETFDAGSSVEWPISIFGKLDEAFPKLQKMVVRFAPLINDYRMVQVDVQHFIWPDLRKLGQTLEHLYFDCALANVESAYDKKIRQELRDEVKDRTAFPRLVDFILNRRQLENFY